MFASTISVTVASGDTIVLNRVNQDNYGSEYVFADANRSANLKIRHSVDSADKDGLVMQRHNVFFEYITFPTPVTSMKKYTSTFTVRSDRFSDPGFAASTAKGIANWLVSGTVVADLVAGVN